MAWFKKKQSDAIGRAVADGMDTGKQQVYEQLQRERPDMAKAVDEINAAMTLDELDVALEHLCITYTPIWHHIIEMEMPKRISPLLFYGSVWYDPACRRGEEIVKRQTGRQLRPGELGDRTSQIQDRDTPGYGGMENPIPPELKSRNLLVAIKSYL